jgi:hypothetical protein
MLVGPLEAIEGNHIGFLILQFPLVLYLAWYFIQALKTMYQETWLLTVCKASLVYLVYMATLGLVFDVVLLA